MGSNQSSVSRRNRYPSKSRKAWRNLRIAGSPVEAFDKVTFISGLASAEESSPTRPLTSHRFYSPRFHQPNIDVVTPSVYVGRVDLPESPIHSISDTARWVAVYRARESERPDAVFRDPFAQRLAGERGQQIAASMPFAEKNSWPAISMFIVRV